jgi:tetratricopeptide (TPR) repeat protein
MIAPSLRKTLASLLLCSSPCLFFIAVSPTSAAESRFRDVQEIDRQLVSLLRAKRFAELDQAVVEIAKAYEADPLKENQMDVAVRAFYRPGAGFLPLLDAWINEMPKSYAARLARGVFHTAFGWEMRGTCTADQTSCAKFAAMFESHAKAVADLDAAYAMNPLLIHALVYKMEIAMAAGDRKTARAMHDQALKLNPLSLITRYWYVTSLLPRWGGSMEAVQEEIEAARPYYERNPALKVLEGRIALERGDDAFYSGNYANAFPFYDEALRHGSHAFYHRQRADTLAFLKLNAASRPDLEAALKLQPNEPHVRFLRGILHYQENKLKQALEDLSAALEGHPRNDEAWDFRGATYGNMGNFKAAAADFEKALELSPGNRAYLDDLRVAKENLKRSADRKQ